MDRYECGMSSLREHNINIDLEERFEKPEMINQRNAGASSPHEMVLDSARVHLLELSLLMYRYGGGSRGPLNKAAL